MRGKPFFPMFVDLSDKNILVVGGGNLATRRVKTLLQFTRNITVVAPKMTPELQELGKLGFIQTSMRPVRKSDFEHAYMVIAATNERRLHDEIYKICKQEGIYINVVDDPGRSDFCFPNIFLKDELVVGITAKGLDQKKARRVRIAVEEAMLDT